jgi:hypothetical protein
VYRTASKLILCLSLLLLALPAAAQASAFDVIKDCQDNSHLDRHHSKGDLQKAENNLPTDVNEYGDCQALIAAALNNVSKGKGNGGSGHGGAGATASAAHRKAHEAAARRKDKAALAAARSHKPSLSVGGKNVQPGDNGLFSAANASNGMPTPLLLGLAAAALLALLGGLAVLKRRAPAFANRIPLLSKLSLPRVRIPNPFSSR